MESVSTVPTMANQSEHINSSSEYSQSELLLLGVAMALLILVIVFGKF